MILATTPRLVLRDLVLADAESIFALNSDPEVLRHVHDAPFKDLSAAQAWIANILSELPRGIGRWAITTHDGTWIGRCSLRRQENEEVLMGYRLLRAYWGRGYASEAVAALLAHAFGQHDLPYVLSKIARDNTGSRRVAEKNGGYLWKVDDTELAVHALVHRFDAPGR